MACRLRQQACATPLGLRRRAGPKVLTLRSRRPTAIKASIGFCAATDSGTGGRSGNWSGIELVTGRPVPCPPGDQNALIRVSAAGVNPIDWKMALATSYHGMPSKFPRVIGTDVAGHIAEAGPGGRCPAKGCP